MRIHILTAILVLFSAIVVLAASAPASPVTTPAPGWVVALHQLGNELWAWFFMGLASLAAAAATKLYLRVSAYLGHKTSAEEEARIRAAAEDGVRALREMSAAKKIKERGEAKAERLLRDLQERFPSADDDLLKTAINAAVERVPGAGATE